MTTNDYYQTTPRRLLVICCRHAFRPMILAPLAWLMTSAAAIPAVADLNATIDSTTGSVVLGAIGSDVDLIFYDLSVVDDSDWFTTANGSANYNSLHDQGFAAWEETDDGVGFDNLPDPSPIFRRCCSALSVRCRS